MTIQNEARTEVQGQPYAGLRHALQERSATIAVIGLPLAVTTAARGSYPVIDTRNAFAARGLPMDRVTKA